jgi:general secretion pathway protein J
MPRGPSDVRTARRAPLAAPFEKGAGFTLVELLVAVTIFGVLCGIAYRSLAVVLDSRGRIEQENRKWRGLAALFTRLEQDVATVAPRPIRDAGDLVAPAFVGGAAARRNDGAIMLTRTALALEPGIAEPPRRLGYRLRGGVVELLTWSVLDQAPRSEPAVAAVLRDVTAFDLRYLDRRGQWHASWPPPGTAAGETALPTAVEVGVTLASGERVTRLFPTSTRVPQ